MAVCTNLELLRKMKDVLAVWRGQCLLRAADAVEYAALADMGLSLMGLYDEHIEAGDKPGSMPLGKILVEVSQRLDQGVVKDEGWIDPMRAILDQVRWCYPRSVYRVAMVNVAAMAVSAVKEYDDA